MKKRRESVVIKKWKHMIFRKMKNDKNIINPKQTLNDIKWYIEFY